MSEACLAHPYASEEGCEACTADLESLRGEIKLLNDELGKKNKALTQAGATVDKTSMLSLAVESLVELVCADRDKLRLHFEITYRRKMREALERGLKQVRQQQLLKPMNPDQMRRTR